MEKKRIYLSLHGGQRFESITWYRGTPINDIIDSIRAVSTFLCEDYQKNSLTLLSHQTLAAGQVSLFI